MEQREYWSEVQNLADEAIAMMRRGELELPEDLQTWIHETVDEHAYVIYTSEAMDVLRHSPNDGAMIEDFGADGVVKDGCLNWSALAYCAMEMDVNERLWADMESVDMDPNDSETWPAEEVPAS